MPIFDDDEEFFKSLTPPPGSDEEFFRSLEATSGVEQPSLFSRLKPTPQTLTLSPPNIEESQKQVSQFLAQSKPETPSMMGNVLSKVGNIAEQFDQSLKPLAEAIQGLTAFAPQKTAKLLDPQFQQEVKQSLDKSASFALEAGILGGAGSFPLRVGRAALGGSGLPFIKQGEQIAKNFGTQIANLATLKGFDTSKLTEGTKVPTVREILTSGGTFGAAEIGGTALGKGIQGIMKGLTSFSKATGKPVKDVLNSPIDDIIRQADDLTEQLKFQSPKTRTEVLFQEPALNVEPKTPLAEQVKILYERADQELAASRKLTFDKFAKRLKTSIVDVSGNIKPELEKMGPAGRKAVVNHTLTLGAGPRAGVQQQELVNPIFKGLSRSERKLLDRMIQSEAIEDLAIRRPDLLQPGDLSAQAHREFLESIPQEQFAKLRASVVL